MSNHAYVFVCVELLDPSSPFLITLNIFVDVLSIASDDKASQILLYGINGTSYNVANGHLQSAWVHRK